MGPLPPCCTLFENICTLRASEYNQVISLRFNYLTNESSIFSLFLSGRSHCRLQGEGQQVRLPLRPRCRLQPQIHQGRKE